jgi:hypothetical protein
MKMQFYTRSILPDGIGQQFQSEALADLLGPEIRAVGEKIEFEDLDDIEFVLQKIREIITNPLVDGVQITIEGLNE